MKLLPKLLFILIIPVVLSISCIIIINYEFSYHAIDKQLEEELVNISTMQAKEVDVLFSTIDSSLLSLAKTATSKNFLKKQQDVNLQNDINFNLKEFSLIYDMINDIHILNNQGKIVSSSIISRIGEDLSDRDYFKDTMNGREYQAVTQRRNSKEFAVRIAKPIVENSQVIGCILAYISIPELAKKTTDTLKVGDTGYCFVYDKNGILLIHPNQQYIGDDNSKLDWVRKALSMKTGMLTYEWNGVKKLLGVGKIPTVGWTLAVNINEEETTIEARKLRNLNITLLIVITLSLIGLIILVVRKLITTPLGVICKLAQLVSSGNLNPDLQAIENVLKNKGEITTTHHALAEMLSKLKERIFYYESILDSIPQPISVTDLNMNWTFINKAVEQSINIKRKEAIGKPCSTWNADICNTSNCGIACLRNGKNSTYWQTGDFSFEIKLSYLTNLAGEKIGQIELVSDITEVTQAKHQAEAALKKGMLTAANQLEGIIDIISSASIQLSSKIKQSEKGATEQALKITETATAMEEMNITVLEVAKNADTASQVSSSTRNEAEAGEKIVQKVVSSIQQVQTQAVKLKEDMAKLDENAQNISQIMNVISDIADQTNLLALNAAIEAARAGEAGRGFAVVADEVRKLAEKTMHSTADVSKVIQAIQNATSQSMLQLENSMQTVNEATQYVNQSGEALKKIVDTVDFAAEQVRCIATASEEQSKTSESIHKSIEHVNIIATQTVKAMHESSDAVSDLSKQANILKNLVGKLKIN